MGESDNKSKKGMVDGRIAHRGPYCRCLSPHCRAMATELMRFRVRPVPHTRYLMGLCGWRLHGELQLEDLLQPRGQMPRE